MDSVLQNKSRRYKWLLVVLVPCLMLAAGGSWVVATESGLRWLAGVIERQSGGSLTVKGISGTLLDTFGMQQLVMRGDGWRITLQDTQLQCQLSALLIGEVKVLRLNTRQVEILTTPPEPSAPSRATPAQPASFDLPLSVSVSQMKLDSFSVLSSEGSSPVFVANDIEASLESDARRFRMHALRVRLPYGVFAGSGEIAFIKPYKLNAQASLDAAMQLSGKSVRAHLVAEAAGDLEHIDAKFNGNGAGMIVNGTAQLEPFSAAPVSRLQVSFSGLDSERLYEGAPHAVLSGSADLRGNPDGALEGSMQVRNAHAAPLDKNGLPLSEVTAQVSLSVTDWQLRQLDVRFADNGHISGKATLAGLGGKAGVQLRVHDLDLAALDTRLPSTRLQGDITVDGNGDDQHAMLALSDGKLDLHAEINRKGTLVELSSVRLLRGDTVLTGHGQLAMDRRRTFRIFSQLRKLDLSKFVSDYPRTDLNAGLEMSGTLLPEVGGSLRIDLANSHFEKYDISGNGQLEFSGVHRATATAEMRLGDNRLNLDIAHGTKSDHLQLALEAPNLAQFGNGLEGKLAGHAELTGSLEQPRLIFSAQGKNLSLPGEHHIAVIDATGDLASAAMQFNLGMNGYRGSGPLNIPQASVELHGSRVDHAISAYARIAQGNDELGELTLKASGGLSDPAQGWQALQWRGTLDELDAQGAVPFHLHAAAPLKLGRDHFQLGLADISIGGGHIQFSETLWGREKWHSAGSFGNLNVRAVNQLQSKPLVDSFEVMRFGGAWDTTADEHLYGWLKVQRESGDWVVDGNTGLRLGLRDLQLSLRAEQDQVHASLDASGEQLGEIKAQASVPMTHSAEGWTILPDAPLSGHLHLRSDDLSWLGPMLDSNLQSGGKLNFDAELIGTFLTPRLKGMAQGDALSLSLLDQGIRLEQGELRARFEPDTVHVDRLVFSAPYLSSPSDKLFADFTLPAGTGMLSATGRIDLLGGSGDLKLKAERLPVAQREDRWIIASGSGSARYAGNTLKLEGNIIADAGFINRPVSDRPRWSDDVQIIGQESAGQSGLQSAVDATVELGDHFYIRASGLEGRLAGQLRVLKEPRAPLHATGYIAAHDALFDAFGQRLEVSHGLMNFQGPADDPGLNILALRKGTDVEAGVEVTGTVRHPLVRLVSTPNVPDAEKLSWIVLGRVPESGSVDTSLLLAAAGNILGGQTVGQFGQTLGVDEISLSQQTGTDSQQNQKVTVGKRLSARARISYEQGLSEVGGITKFTYILTPRITIVTRTGNEDALDLFYSFRFY